MISSSSGTLAFSQRSKVASARTECAIFLHWKKKKKRLEKKQTKTKHHNPHPPSDQIHSNAHPEASLPMKALNGRVRPPNPPHWILFTFKKTRDQRIQSDNGSLYVERKRRHSLFQFAHCIATLVTETTSHRPQLAPPACWLPTRRSFMSFMSSASSCCSFQNRAPLLCLCTEAPSCRSLADL